MPTRKTFLAAATAVTASAATLRAAPAQAGAAPTPAPTSSAQAHAAKPSLLATERARSLQRGLPKAHLTDATTQLIAKDIDDNFAIADTFRGRSTAGLPPPDFVFTASDADRP
jgi:hypothetical protein